MNDSLRKEIKSDLALIRSDSAPTVSDDPDALTLKAIAASDREQQKAMSAAQSRDFMMHKLISVHAHENERNERRIEAFEKEVACVRNENSQLTTKLQMTSSELSACKKSMQWQESAVIVSSVVSLLANGAISIGSAKFADGTLGTVLIVTGVTCSVLSGVTAIVLTWWNGK